MVKTLRFFLECFMKNVVIANISSKRLKTINIENNFRADVKTFFLGDRNTSTISSTGMTDMVKNFYEKLKVAYIKAAKYIQKKFVLDNLLLYSLSRLEPVACGHSE